MSGPAKVFVSCGQKTPEERQVASEISSMLTDLGFDPYVATEEQTLKGLRENIFWNLESAEYFLFVDFRREQLANQSEHRGSLFTNQELALASFLDLDVMTFQQTGVLKLDGLMRFLQANAVEFSNPADLPDLIRKRIEKVRWESGWKRRLAFRLCDPLMVDARAQDGALNRFFHLSVGNPHSRKPALLCSCIVESIERTGGGGFVDFRPGEVHWAGSSEQFVTIPVGRERQVDIGFINHRNPAIFMFNSFTTSSQFLPPLLGPGEYDVKFTVVSQNFQPATALVRVQLGFQVDQSEVALLECVV